MARPKWLNAPRGKSPPKEIVELMKRDAGKGVADRVVDRAFWLTADLDPWVDALEAIDKRGDKKPLLDLLESDYDLPPRARIFLADLIERYQLKLPPHRPRTPAYDMTDADAMLTIALADVRKYQARGMSVDDAVAAVAKGWSIKHQNMLANFCAGKRGSSRRMKKRRLSRP
jgi:hypothetical protein